MIDQNNEREILSEAEKASLLKEEALNALDIGIKKYQEGDSDLVLLSAAVSVWKVVSKNEILNQKLTDELRKRRQTLHQMASLDISNSGDPVAKRYNPNFWMGEVPPQFRHNLGKYVLDRTNSLRGLIQSL